MSTSLIITIIIIILIINVLMYNREAAACLQENKEEKKRKEKCKTWQAFQELLSLWLSLHLSLELWALQVESLQLLLQLLQQLCTAAASMGWVIKLIYNLGLPLQFWSQSPHFCCNDCSRRAMTVSWKQVGEAGFAILIPIASLLL